MGFLKFIALQSLQTFDFLKANLLLISSGNKLEELNFHIYVTSIKHVGSLGCLLTMTPEGSLKLSSSIYLAFIRSEF